MNTCSFIQKTDTFSTIVSKSCTLQWLFIHSIIILWTLKYFPLTKNCPNFRKTISIYKWKCVMFKRKHVFSFIKHLHLNKVVWKQFSSIFYSSRTEWEVTGEKKLQWKITPFWRDDSHFSFSEKRNVCLWCHFLLMKTFSDFWFKNLNCRKVEKASACENHILLKKKQAFSLIKLKYFLQMHLNAIILCLINFLILSLEREGADGVINAIPYATLFVTFL